MMEQKPVTAFSFWELLREKRLMAARCAECGKVFLSSRSFRITCCEENTEWVRLRGEGRLAVIAVDPTFMIEEVYNREEHYCSAIVKLEEELCTNRSSRGSISASRSS